MDAPSDKERAPTRSIGPLEVTSPTDRTIVMTRTFDAPRRLVFDAWTRSEHVTHWWDPSGKPLRICEIDLRPGGAFRWGNQGPGGTQHSFAGTYREIVAPERLVFTVQTSASGPESVGTLLFSEDSGQTTLTMTIECRSRADRDALLEMRIDVGTAQTLTNLAAYLQTARL